MAKGTTRRDLLMGAIGAIPASLVFGAPLRALAAPAAPEIPRTDGPGVRFEPHVLRARARAMAGGAFVPPETKLPKGFEDLSYDKYRAIAFRPEETWLRDGPGPFRIEWMPRGFLYHDRIDFDAVEGEQSLRIEQTDRCFAFPADVPAPKDGEVLGWSGFRAKAPINGPVAEEFVVFQGARAISAPSVAATSTAPRRAASP